jgi:hypothetical protein
MLSRYTALQSIAVESEKWIYPTISENLTPFRDSSKHLHDFEKPIGAAIREQQHSY